MSKIRKKFNVRQYVKMRSHGSCEDCHTFVGTSNLIAGHLNHQRDGNYNNPENMVARCRFCEAKYHLVHADNPSKIGLTKKLNDATVIGRILELTQIEQRKLLSTYRHELHSIARRLYCEEDRAKHIQLTVENNYSR